MKPVLELLIDANIVLILAFCLWRVSQKLIANSRFRHDYGRQLLLLKAVLLLTIFSPVFAYLGVKLGHHLSPNTPLTVSDIAVAIYLQGDISMPAVQFEALLNTRDRWIDGLLASQSGWITVAQFAVLAIVAFFAARAARSIWQVRRALSGSHVWRRTKKVDIRFSDTVGVPFAARGFFRRHVVIPSALMTRPRELQFVLAHEFQHLRAGDVEWEFVIEILRPILFWNPAFLLWKRAFDQLRELSCDQNVITSRNISPHDYASCLLDFCERRASSRPPRLMNVALVSGDAAPARRSFENRIRALYNAPKGGNSAWLLALVLIMGLGVSLAAASVRQPGDWSHDRLMLSTIVNLERMNARPYAAPVW